MQFVQYDSDTWLLLAGRWYARITRYPTGWIVTRFMMDYRTDEYAELPTLTHVFRTPLAAMHFTFKVMS